MATNNGCCSTAARRLSDLLWEQQEPFLLLHLLLQDHDDDSGLTPAASATRRRRSLLHGHGSTAATVSKLALRWADDLLAGCCFSFPCATATRQRLRFRRLPRANHGHRDVVAPAADHYDGGAVDCGKQQQQLSPVSVLDLHSDDESSHHRDEPSHSEDDGSGKPSTSGTETMTSPSPPSTSHDHDLPGKTPAMEPVERFQRNNIIEFASAWEWKSVTADISRIPSMVVELDFSASPRDDWRRLVVGGGGEEEARQVARSIEVMIFEELRWEAVRDMLSLCDNTDSSWVC